MPTNTERIDELIRVVVKLETMMEERSKRHDSEYERLREETRRLQQTVDSHATQLTAVEQRASALEKGSDRRWQLAPIIVAAAAIVISILFGIANILVAVKK